VFLVGWHVGVRGELIVGRLAPSWSVLPFAALAGRAAEHPVDPTAQPAVLAWWRHPKTPMAGVRSLTPLAA